ncbi:MAG: M2 family metallopeptidase [Gemmatimonadota bacterium]
MRATHKPSDRLDTMRIIPRSPAGRILLALALSASLPIACGGGGEPETETPATVMQGGSPDASEAGGSPEAEAFLREYAVRYQQLSYESAKAEWASNTHIVEGDTTNAARTRAAREALARFVGSVENIRRIREFLSRPALLSPVQRRELEAMLYEAADQPQTAPQVVKDRIAAEADQVEKLYGFPFRLAGEPTTPNGIDRILRESRDLARRRSAWMASKEVGRVLKPGLVRLRDLRNRTVQALGYPDFFAYQVSDYGMTTDEMLRLCDQLNEQLRPLYRELHTWARYELAGRYGAPVPDLIPADWLPNRWGQDWTALVKVEGLNVDSAVAQQDAEWVVRQAEAFYVSLGFQPLPDSFWERSSLYPLPPGAPFKKNTHASAWHLDLDTDVRSLMSVEPNSYWYGTAHHELGHIYYYLSYSRPEVPLVLRRGANRAYHEGLGSMIGMAAQQRRFLVDRGLAPAGARVDTMRQLLREALDFVVFIPWSAGVMTQFEKQLYADSLPADRFNQAWWELKRRYQGIAPPGPRGEEYADAATKTHINDDPAQYYDYALSYALLFQLHAHIAKAILGQNPHDTDYYGHETVGDFLRRLMAPGATRPWREVLRETTGRELDAAAMVEYFSPLLSWLRERNRGRTATLEEL